MTKRRALALALLLAAAPACWRIETAPAPTEPDQSRAVDALRIAPPGVPLALGGPAFEAWESRALDWAADSDDDAQPAAAYRDRLARFARRLGLPEADTLAGLARSLNLDPAAPFGVYMGEPREADGEPPVAVALQALPNAQAEAEAALREALFRGGDVPSQALADGGPVLWSAGERGPAFAYAAPWFIVGDPALVRGAALLVARPGSIAYGSEECPVEAPEEWAALIRMDRLAVMAPLLGDRGPSLEGFAARYGPAPAVVTLNWNDAGVEIHYRLNAAEHPDIAAESDSTPLVLAPMLPPAAEAFAGVRFDEAALDAFAETWLGLLPESLRGDPVYKMAELQLEQAAAALDGEIAVALLGIEADQPALVVLATLRDTAAAQTLFGAFSPLFAPVDEHNGAAIYGLPEGLGFPLSYAAHESRLVLGPNAVMVKGALMQWDAGEPSPLFGSLEPPLDPAAPGSFVLLAPQKLLRDLALPLSRDALEPRLYARLDAVLARFGEVRILRSAAGGWRSARLILAHGPFAESADYGSLSGDER